MSEYLDNDAVKIFVASHKEFKLPRVEGYSSIRVGRGCNTDHFDYRDDILDNITIKNPRYGELTGLYWIWKNDNTQIVAFCHYRRYFITSLLTDDVDNYLKPSDIVNLLGKYDVILPKRVYFFKKNRNVMQYNPNQKDISEVYTAIHKLCPEYLNDFDYFLDQNSMYPCNMLVMRREMLNAYCKWLFDILFYIENNHNDDSDYEERKRVLGCIGERLMYVWMRHNVNKNRIKEIHIINIEKKENRALELLRSWIKTLYGIALLR